MNPNLEKLQSYPFEKLRLLLKETTPNSDLTPINLSIGEPKHGTAEFIKQALIQNLDGLATYPNTQGGNALRITIAAWLKQRYHLKSIDPETQVLPVNGSREALFAFAQTIIDSSKTKPIVILPNPFYQIYEGAAYLAGAQTYFINLLAEKDFALDLDSVPEEIWSRTQLIYVCSPHNPTGKVLSLEDWQKLFNLSDQYGFVIASDECYSEIYFDETQPPLGALEASQSLKRESYPRLVVFSSLSKRSNVPGMRSGFVAGSASLLEKFLLYRTYHGSAMNPAIQAASIVAWNDEAHVRENRKLYLEKLQALVPILKPVLPTEIPQGGFYFWARTPTSDIEFTRALYRDCHVTVLPGRYLAREHNGINPGEHFVRIALVPSIHECLEAAQRITTFLKRGSHARTTKNDRTSF